MKKNKTILFGAILFALVSVMPAWAIWEGNAGIAASTEFPSAGFFAKSDMFPKNTIVEIVNLETDIAIRVVIVGASGVPGLVAMLSPEAAAALNVKTGSVSRVRISIPSPVAETPASGTIAGGSGAKTADPDVNNEESALEAEKLAGTSTSPGETESLASILAPESNPLVPLTGPDSAESAVTENPSNASPETVTASTETAVVTAPEPMAETSETTESSESPEVAESPEALEGPEAAETPEVAEAPMETPSEATVSPGTELAEAEPPTEPVAETPTVVPPAPETAETTGTSAVYDEPELVVPSAETAEVAAGEPATPPEAEAVTIPESEPVPSVAEETPVPEVSTESVVTLEPAEMLPPPAPEEAKEPELAEVPEAPEVAAISAAPVEVAPAVAPATTGMGDLPLISTLEPGKYYVQIASYSDVANVRQILASWGTKYPISVQKAESKNKTLLKVFVGPVTRDEYGAILERFKAAGFRDAFVKKGA